MTWTGLDRCKRATSRTAVCARARCSHHGTTQALTLKRSAVGQTGSERAHTLLHDLNRRTAAGHRSRDVNRRRIAASPPIRPKSGLEPHGPLSSPAHGSARTADLSVSTAVDVSGCNSAKTHPIDLAPPPIDSPRSPAHVACKRKAKRGRRLYADNRRI